MSAVSTRTSEYELVLMLDPEVADERRDGIAADAMRRIEAGGTLKQDRAWGMRKLAYEIRQRTEADYRFFRFAAEPAVLEELDHTLKIADGVLRFRIFEVDPDSPVIEPPPPVALASSTPGRGQRRGDGERRDRAEQEPAAEPPAPAAEAPAPAAEPPPAEPAAAQTPAPPVSGSQEPPPESAPPREGDAGSASEGDEPAAS